MDDIEFNKIKAEVESKKCSELASPLFKNLNLIAGRRPTNPSIVLSADMMLTTQIVGVVLKLFCDEKNIMLNTEKNIYKDVVPKLYKHTPHVMKCFGVIECTTVDISKYIEIPDDLAKEFANISCPGTNRTYSIIILERFEKKDIIDIKSVSNVLDTVGLKKLLFQLLYTVECFTRIGMRHNDLQYENILVTKLPAPITTQYSLDSERVFYITYQYTPIIFDFDKSNSYLLPVIETAEFIDINGQQKNLCYETGICNGRNDIYDPLRVMCLFEKNIKPGWLQETFRQLYPLIKYPIDIANRSNKESCFSSHHGFPFGSNSIVYFPKAMDILNTSFDEFKKATAQPVANKYALPTKNISQAIKDIKDVKYDKFYSDIASRVKKQNKLIISFTDNTELLNDNTGTIYIGTPGKLKELLKELGDLYNKDLPFTFVEFEKSVLYFVDIKKNIQDIIEVFNHAKDSLVAKTAQCIGQKGGNDSSLNYSAYATHDITSAKQYTNTGVDGNLYAYLAKKDTSSLINCDDYNYPYKIVIEDGSTDKFKEILVAVRTALSDPLFFHTFTIQFNSKYKAILEEIVSELKKSTITPIDVPIQIAEQTGGQMPNKYYNKYKKYKLKYLKLRQMNNNNNNN